jgi:hypothetical protein
MFISFNFDVDDNIVNKTSREYFIFYKMDGKVYNCEFSFITLDWDKLRVIIQIDNRFLSRARDYCFLHRVQTVSGTHPNFYLTDT